MILGPHITVAAPRIWLSQLTHIHCNSRGSVRNPQIASSRTKGNICSAIMANIGLDFPAPPQHRGGNGRNIGHGSHVRAHLINISNSLMIVGKYIAIPRHGKVREFRNKSPLGGN